MPGYPSPERVMIKWAHDITSIFNLCGGRIYNDLPNQPVMPVLVVTLAAGAPVHGEVPGLTMPMLQFDAYGEKANRNAVAKRIAPDFNAAENLLIEVMDNLQAIDGTGGTIVTTNQETAIVYGVQFAAQRRTPLEKDTRWAHYAADVFVTMRKTA